MRDVVVVINQEDFERRRLRQILVDAGYEVLEAGNAVEGFMHALGRGVDLIIMSEHLPPLTAEDMLPVLRRFSTVPVIVVGSGGESEAVEALELGADFYLNSPVHGPALLARARALIRRRRGSAHQLSPRYWIAKTA